MAGCWTLDIVIQCNVCYSVQMMLMMFYIRVTLPCLIVERQFPALLRVAPGNWMGYSAANPTQCILFLVTGRCWSFGLIPHKLYMMGDSRHGLSLVQQPSVFQLEGISCGLCKLACEQSRKEIDKMQLLPTFHRIHQPVLDSLRLWNRIEWDTEEEKKCYEYFTHSNDLPLQNGRGSQRKWSFLSDDALWLSTSCRVIPLLGCHCSVWEQSRFDATIL